jgi:cytochrome c oxidase subunit 2
MMGAPLSYLQSNGAASAPLTALAWGLGLIAVLVIVVITVILIAALYRTRTPEVQDANGHYRVRRSGSGLSWIYIGLGVTIPILAICTVWTLAVLARVSSPPAPPPLTIQVTAHRWWWEVRYLDADPSQVFTTANEIHVPAGEAVRVLVSSTDVIHSFWVPRLAGKIDVVPGITNVTWLQADAPGRFRGQCGEFCGLQHARMGMEVVAETPANFAQWRAGQLTAPVSASAPVERAGDVFVSRCGACHTVRGTAAGGIVGPDLSHFASRSTIAAGTLPNDPGDLTAWIRDPQAFKPGVLMPQVPMSVSERGAVVAYLESVK